MNFNAKYVFTELDIVTGKHLCHHFVTLQSYKDIISFECFTRHKKHRNKTKTLWFIPKRKEDYDFSEMIWNKHCIELNIAQDEIPQEHHDSLWSFYKHIKYNYKTKKYDNN